MLSLVSPSLPLATAGPSAPTPGRATEAIFVLDVPGTALPDMPPTSLPIGPGISLPDVPMGRQPFAANGAPLPVTPSVTVPAGAGQATLPGITMGLPVGIVASPIAPAVAGDGAGLTTATTPRRKDGPATVPILTLPGTPPETASGTGADPVVAPIPDTATRIARDLPRPPAPGKLTPPLTQIDPPDTFLPADPTPLVPDEPVLPTPVAGKPVAPADPDTPTLPPARAGKPDAEDGPVPPTVIARPPVAGRPSAGLPPITGKPIVPADPAVPLPLAPVLARPIAPADPSPAPPALPAGAEPVAPAAEDAKPLPTPGPAVLVGAGVIGAQRVRPVLACPVAPTEGDLPSAPMPIAAVPVADNTGSTDVPPVLPTPVTAKQPAPADAPARPVLPRRFELRGGPERLAPMPLVTDPDERAEDTAPTPDEPAASPPLPDVAAVPAPPLLAPMPMPAPRMEAAPPAGSEPAQTQPETVVTAVPTVTVLPGAAQPTAAEPPVATTPAQASAELTTLPADAAPLPFAAGPARLDQPAVPVQERPSLPPVQRDGPVLPSPVTPPIAAAAAATPAPVAAQPAIISSVAAPPTASVTSPLAAPVLPPVTTASATTVPDASVAAPPGPDRPIETQARPAPIAAAPAPVLPEAASRPVAAPAREVFAAAIERSRRAPASTAASGTAPAEMMAPATPAALRPVAAAQDVPLDMTAARWTQDMVTRIERMLDHADAGDGRIRLRPDALGNVDLTVRNDGGQVHVHFRAEIAETRQMLRDAAPRLAEAAEARGLQLGDASVSGGSQQQQQDQGRQRDARAAPATPLPNRRAPREASADTTPEQRLA